MSAPVRTLLADEHPVFRTGLRLLLEHAGGFTIEAEADATSTAVALAEGHRFELAITSVTLPPAGGTALVRVLHERQPDCAVLVLSAVEEPLRIAEVLRAGARGYALKRQPPAAVREAIATVLTGARYLAPELPAAEIELLVAADALPLDRLTVRERDVFQLLVRGKTNARVAETLGIAPSTVEAHRRHIMQKLEARSVVDLVQLARRHGMLRSV